MGRYRVVRPLGEGGMGRVFLGEAVGPSGFVRRVVLKKVRDQLDDRLARALLDEARLVATLVHRNIVPVLDLHEASGERVVVMEYVDGIDLDRLLQVKQRLPWELAVFVAMEIAAGLDYAHRKTGLDGGPLGLVHRDVNPANILLSWEGEVKLTDFGVARLTRNEEAEGSIAGKIAYMSPEQVRGQAVDGRTDVYALGLVIYEMLTGKHPMAGRDRDATIAWARAGGVPPISPGLAPPPVQLLVARATAPRPGERYASAAELRQALAEVPGLPPDPAERLRAFLAEARAPATSREAILAVARERSRPRAATQVAGRAPRQGMSLGRLVAIGVALGLLGIGVVGAIAWRLRAPDEALPAAAPATAKAAPVPPAAAPPAEAPPAEAPPTPTRPAVARRGTLSVNAVPWAKVTVDGRSIGPTPIVGLSLSAGKHKVKLVTAGGDVRERVVQVGAGKDTRLVVDFAKP